MPRRKAEEVVDIKTPDSEDTQFINAADIEAAEAELLAEEPSEEGESEAVKESKPRRSRARRKKPELSIENAAQETAEGTNEVEAVAEEPVEDKAEKKPAPRRRSRAKAHEVKPEVKIDPTFDSSFAAKNMEEVQKQWSAIRDILEKVNTSMPKSQPQPLPQPLNEFVETGEYFRPQVPKVPFITKFATASSLVATLLSVLSLSLSQSARNAVVNGQVIAERHSQPMVAERHAQTVTPTASAPVPSYPTPQIAANPSPRRLKDSFFKIKK